MKIGVLSDIHMKRDDGGLQGIIDRYLQDVEMFLLCGDFISLDIYEMFLFKDAAAVSGNMDDVFVKKTLPVKRVVTVNGFRIGLIHGWGPPAGIETRISREFDDVDCIVYGHTHRARNEKVAGTIFFNQGSPTDNRFAPYNSIGILDVTDDGITGSIIRL